MKKLLAKWNKGQVQTVVVLGGALIAALGGVWGAKVTASGETNERLYDYKLEQQRTDSSQDQLIGQLKTSACVQNDNMRNIAAALKATFVSDPNCK
jgi:hypothetical protein